MKKLILYIFALFLLLPVGGCGVEESYLPVEFEAVNCESVFKPSRVTPLVMYSMAEWLKYFNLAGVSVDFDSRFLVSVCCPATDVKTYVKIIEVLNKEQSLYVKYTIEKEDKMTSAMLPHATVAIDRGYAGCDIGFFDVTGME